MIMQRVIPCKRAIVPCIFNGIAVMLALHVKAGMEALRRFIGIYDPYIPRQAGIQRKCEFFSRYAAVRIKMRHLGQSMYAAVSPARGIQHALMAGQLKKLLLHYLLYAHAGKLPLPALVIRAVILNYHAHAPFHRGLTSPSPVCIKASSITPSTR